jgi:hypothetical protein
MRFPVTCSRSYTTSRQSEFTPVMDLLLDLFLLYKLLLSFTSEIQSFLHFYSLTIDSGGEWDWPQSYLPQIMHHLLLSLFLIHARAHPEQKLEPWYHLGHVQHLSPRLPWPEVRLSWIPCTLFSWFL